MNDTTVIEAGRQEDVRAYVWAVRAWLADLPADEVEDLTAGMEADLAERAAESGGTLGALLGEPEAYAAELRSAAGLPPRAATVVADAVAREPWTARLVRGSHDLVARHPWLRELATDVVAGSGGRRRLGAGVGAGHRARPAAPARRSGPVDVAGARPAPARAAGFGAAGRAGRCERARRPPAPADAGVLHVGLVGPLDQAVLEQPVTPGLVSNGQPVSNVFVYDAAGHRVEDVRIFDQFGQPLQVSSDVVAVPPGPEGRELVAWPPDERALSVFPLRLVPGADPWAQQDGPWAPPAQMAPLAGSAVPSATPTGTTSPTP